ncbi:single-stranded DNA-binding protein [Streptomyces sp. NBC_01435]|uniref:single-stranded DNA-binding protein n=1 Tax=Streptomyces sp. NBC_01435 TaxID=2903865 RepID=UPI002E3033C6|nr:single-stranded DNA-binding protein [Streptomyces sp. NBC_01435]
MSSSVTLTGRLTAVPELRFSAQGTAVAAFTIVTSRRVKDQQTNEWSDADVTYWDCKAFKQLAQNIADSLDKGMEVVATGRVAQESWEDKQTGQKRSKMAVRIDAIGPSLGRATAVVTKAGSGQGQPAYQQARRQQGAASAEDPWASGTPGTGRPAGGGGGWGSGGGDEPPPF